jgi:hypothetical protein
MKREITKKKKKKKKKNSGANLLVREAAKMTVISGNTFVSRITKM